MQAVVSYIRNIVVFIIFSTILEIILPDNKFKEYVNFVTGLILIFLMLKPIGMLFNATQIPSALSFQFDKSILQQEQAYYEDKQKELILEEYKTAIHSQLETIVNASYILLNASIGVSSDNNSFGEITQIDLTITEKNTEVKKSLIRIERVDLKNNEPSESEELKKLKNTIADFYNLSVGNINIIVQKKER